jgi:hypothetical protein
MLLFLTALFCHAVTTMADMKLTSTIGNIPLFRCCWMRDTSLDSPPSVMELVYHHQPVPFTRYFFLFLQLYP